MEPFKRLTDTRRIKINQYNALFHFQYGKSIIFLQFLPYIFLQNLLAVLMVLSVLPKKYFLSQVFRTVLRQQAHSHASSLHAMKQTPLVLEDEKPEARENTQIIT